MIPILIPAYGRDYKYKSEIIEAYREGKDFLIHDVSSRWDGSYCSIRDFMGETVELRYNKKRSLVIFTA